MDPGARAAWENLPLWIVNGTDLHATIMWATSIERTADGTLLFHGPESPVAFVPGTWREVRRMTLTVPAAVATPPDYGLVAEPSALYADGTTRTIAPELPPASIVFRALLDAAGVRCPHRRRRGLPCAWVECPETVDGREAFRDGTRYLRTIHYSFDTDRITGFSWIAEDVARNRARKRAKRAMGRPG